MQDCDLCEDTSVWTGHTPWRDHCWEPGAAGYYNQQKVELEIAHSLRLLHATKRMYALRILKKSTSLSTKSLIAVYNAIIRSILEYASPVFGCLTTGLANKLERIQARCHRIICSPPSRTSCLCGRFADLKTRRKLAMLKLLEHTLLPGHILHSICPQRSKRTNRLILPHASTSRFLSSFIPHASYLMTSHWISLLILSFHWISLSFLWISVFLSYSFHWISVNLPYYFSSSLNCVSVFCNV